MSTTHLQLALLALVTALVVTQSVPFKRQFFPGQLELVNDAYVCEPYEQPVCQRFNLKEARFPNRRNQYADDAVEEFNDFSGLIASQCSSKIAVFLCSFYFPVCPRDDNNKTVRDPRDGTIIEILPCKELCEEVRRDCETVFVNHTRRPWPSHFDCSHDYFKSSDAGLCNRGPEDEESTPGGSSTTPTPQPGTGSTEEGGSTTPTRPGTGSTDDGGSTPTPQPGTGSTDDGGSTPTQPGTVFILIHCAVQFN